jgi:hypothetical protein
LVRPTAKSRYRANRSAIIPIAHRSTSSESKRREGAVLYLKDPSFFKELAARVPDFVRNPAGENLDIVPLSVNDLRRLKSLASKNRKMDRSG